mgnify:CR=1 FL=1
MTNSKFVSLVSSWLNDPAKFCVDVFGEQPDNLQKQIFDAIALNDRVAVRSGNGPGKTWTAARIALWFFVTRPNSLVITTAPTWTQVQNLLWKEIRGGIEKSPILKPFVYMPPRDAELFMVRPDGNYGPGWGCLGRSTDRKENMQGFHNPYLMFIVDEASGVDDTIFEAIEGTQTQEGVNTSKMLLIGNPTKDSGYFFEVFHKRAANWKTFHLDSRKSPRVKKEWIRQMGEEYGEDSNFYQVHVLGNFPQYGEDTLIPLHWIEKAVL